MLKTTKEKPRRDRSGCLSCCFDWWGRGSSSSTPSVSSDAVPSEETPLLTDAPAPALPVVSGDRESKGDARRTQGDATPARGSGLRETLEDAGRMAPPPAVHVAPVDENPAQSIAVSLRQSADALELIINWSKNCGEFLDRLDRQDVEDLRSGDRARCMAVSKKHGFGFDKIKAGTPQAGAQTREWFAALERLHVNLAAIARFPREKRAPLRPELERLGRLVSLVGVCNMITVGKAGLAAGLSEMIAGALSRDEDLHQLQATIRAMLGDEANAEEETKSPAQKGDDELQFFLKRVLASNKATSPMEAQGAAAQMVKNPFLSIDQALAHHREESRKQATAAEEKRSAPVDTDEAIAALIAEEIPTAPTRLGFPMTREAFADDLARSHGVSRDAVLRVLAGHLEKNAGEAAYFS